MGGSGRSVDDSEDFNSDQMKEYDLCQDVVEDKIDKTPDTLGVPGA